MSAISLGLILLNNSIWELINEMKIQWDTKQSDLVTKDHICNNSWFVQDLSYKLLIEWSNLSFIMEWLFHLFQNISNRLLLEIINKLLVNKWKSMAYFISVTNYTEHDINQWEKTFKCNFFSYRCILIFYHRLKACLCNQRHQWNQIPNRW